MDYDLNTIPLVNPAARDAAGELIPHPVFMDHRNNVMCFRDLTQGGKLVKLDLGVADVHFDRPLANYAVGYSLEKNWMIADQVMPVVPTERASDRYYVWDKDDAFQEVQATVAAPGGNIMEVSPRQTNTPFVTAQYAVRTFLPTEVEANADAALKIGMRYLQVPMDKLLLSRELRVKRVVMNAANYGAAFKQTLAAGEKWNGGATSDPIKNILDRCDAALKPITHIVMSPRTYNAFSQNAQVLKYVASKTAIKPKPGVENASEFAALLELPPFVIGREKFKSSATAYPYIWGDDVALYHLPTVMPPMGTPISFNTFRWQGGIEQGINAEKAALFGSVSMESGWGVRTYYDPVRGAQGGRGCVVWHQDAEQFVDDAVSGLIVGAYQ